MIFTCDCDKGAVITYEERVVEEKWGGGKAILNQQRGRPIVFFWYKDKGGHMIQQDLQEVNSRKFSELV